MRSVMLPHYFCGPTTVEVHVVILVLVNMVKMSMQVVYNIPD